MKLYFAGTYTRNRVFKPYIDANINFYMLESFYYILPWQFDWIKTNNTRFILDSGAFSFMNGKVDVTNSLQQYISDYIKCINENSIKNYIELDLDSIMPLKDVEKIRFDIESKTHVKSIPVWHASRGEDYFHDMCKEYETVAIGGIVTKEIPKSKFGIFHNLINIAHKYGCSIHGLGIGSPTVIQKYNFDSVDSTAWLAGSIGKKLYHFDGLQLKPHTNKTGKLTQYKLMDSHNVTEWMKYSKFMETFKHD